ncbi:cupin domain-containing protein [Streptomyces griseorubiginosus]|uniref:cupin domain-containing protein n=1 Tax=Streptomyces griseorubiginosus TaxID=67304 RepID=UPI003679CFD2
MPDGFPLDVPVDHHAVRARATGAVFARTVAAPPWGLRLGGSIQPSVHTVVRGRGYLWLDTPGSAVELIPGSVRLVRGGPDHYIGHEPGAACLEPEEFRTHHAQMGPETTRKPPCSCAAPTGSPATNTNDSAEVSNSPCSPRN